MNITRILALMLITGQFPLYAQISSIHLNNDINISEYRLLPDHYSALMTDVVKGNYDFTSFELHNLNLQNSLEAEPFIKDPDFWLSVSVNLLGTGLFISRVHHPPTAEWFGYGTQVMGIPALALGISDIYNGQCDFSTYANLGYAAWAIYAVTVDHILDINYRDPFKPAIIIPYVVSYYLAVGSMSAGQYENGWVPWAISGAVCIINVGASFYARSKGAD